MSHFQQITRPDGTLGFEYNYDQFREDERFADSHWRYWRLLPIDLTAGDQIVTLGEGGTPLLRSHYYASNNIYFKDDTRNPTGSHKDRSLSVAVSHARSTGAKISVVVSAGSTGISNAALAARAGMRSITVMTETAPIERIYPVYMLGSTVIQVRSEIDPIVDAVAAICQSEPGLYLSTTTRQSNAYQAEGSKTIAHEIVAALGAAPDWVVVPVGGGGTIAAIWRGFQDMRALGRVDKLPRLVGVLPEHYNALEIALERDFQTWEDITALSFADKPPTILAKIAHAHPPDGLEALAAVRESNGLFASVSDDAAFAGQETIAHHEGLYVEPSSSVILPVIDRLLAENTIHADDVVVGVLCGSGFRETFINISKRPLQPSVCDLNALSDRLRAAL